MNQAALMNKPDAPAGNPKQMLHSARKKLEAGNLPEAEKALKRVLALEPRNTEALHWLGVVAYKMGLLPQASELISQALEIEPGYPQALNNLGSVMLAMGKADQAERLFAMSLKLKPDYPEALGNLGALLNTLGRADEGEAMLRKAVKLAPKSAEARNNLGNVLKEQGRLKEALNEYQQAIRLAPTNASCAASAGQLKMIMGIHDEALSLFNHAITNDPLNIQALSGLSASKKIRQGDPELGLFRRASAKLGRMPLKDQIDFLFAYGKVHDDVGEYGEAFKCIEQANAMRSRERRYARAQGVQTANRFREVYQPELFERLEGRGCDSEQPVFIVGMPRSGTTLTEQILSSHPDVYGAGELTFFNTIANEALGIKTPSDVPEIPDKLNPELLSVIGQGYLEQLAHEHPNAPAAKRVTDKLPGNFWYVGLIKLVFPHARVIHVRRNPVDTCLSCFQKNFARGHSFSNSLDALGHFYGLYEQMMAHWRDVLPGFMLEIDYEALVGEPEASARALVDYVGLEWNEACLRPNENRRAVNTASHWQVRQAVHTGSVERWRRYETELQPLLDALRNNGVELR